MNELRLEELKLTNFLAWKNLKIDLSKYSGPTIILAERDGDSRKSNGTGKSSLIHGIIYALYGITRGDTLDDLITTGETKMEVTLTVSLDGEIYTITRSKKLHGSQKASIRHKDKTGNEELLNPDVTTALGMPSYETLASTIYSGQHALEGITALKPTAQKDLLSLIFGLDKYINLENILRKAIAEDGQATAAELAAMEALKLSKENIVLQPQEEIAGRTIAAQKAISEAQIAFAAANKKRIEIDLANDSVKTTELARQGVIRQLSDLRNQINNGIICTELANIRKSRSELERLQAEIKNKELTYKTLDETIRNLKILPPEELGRLREDKIAKLTKCQELTHLCNDIQNELIKNRKDYEKVSIRGLVCKECGAKITKEAWESALKSLADRKRELDNCFKEARDLRDTALIAKEAAEQNLTEAEKNATIYQSLISQKAAQEKDLIGAWTRLQALPELQNREKVLMSTLVEEQEKYKNRESELEKQLRGFDMEIRQARNTITGEALASAELAAAQSVLNKAQDDLQTALTAEATQKSNLAQIAKLDAMLAERKSKLSATGKKSLINGELLKAFGSNGIPALILDTTLANLQGHIDHYLGILSDNKLRAKFITTKVTSGGKVSDTLQIRVTDALGERSLNSFSGGEKVRIFLALRMALARFIALKYPGRMNFLIIDEIADLDMAGLENMIQLLKRVSTDFKQIFIVSHLDQIKDAFESTLILRRNHDTNTNNN